ncbi:uncharacterized protein LOC141913094 [Tubulanus polymorphus]|uniref:uncharacterized protein LOC141913094 n=1 Tax=Tubulanus polymorphus TaxID=672921 RepID=UPI003DA31E9D
MAYAHKTILLYLRITLLFGYSLGQYSAQRKCDEKLGVCYYLTQMGPSSGLITDEGSQNLLDELARDENIYGNVALALTGHQVEWHWEHDRRTVSSQGCYNYVKGLEPTLSIESDDMSPKICITTCKSKNTKYATVWDGRYCNCFAEWHMSEATSSSINGCKEPCAGSPEEFCGGRSAHYLYDIGTDSVADTDDTDWRPGRPTTNKFQYTCATIEFDYDYHKFSWTEQKCIDRYYFICEYSGEKCSESGKCFDVPEDLPLTWYEARSFCKSRQGHLAAPDSAANRRLLYSRLKEARQYWIGLTFAVWTWSEQLDYRMEANYTRWDPRSRTPNVSPKYSVVMQCGGAGGCLWKSVNTETTAVGYYLQQKDLIPKTTTASTSLSSSTSSPATTTTSAVTTVSTTRIEDPVSTTRPTTSPPLTASSTRQTTTQPRITSTLNNNVGYSIESEYRIPIEYIVSGVGILIVLMIIFGVSYSFEKRRRRRNHFERLHEQAHFVNPLYRSPDELSTRRASGIETSNITLSLTVVGQDGLEKQIEI